jgi:hypothetical protein
MLTSRPTAMPTAMQTAMQIETTATLECIQSFEEEQ